MIGGFSLCRRPLEAVQAHPEPEQNMLNPVNPVENNLQISHQRKDSILDINGKVKTSSLYSFFFILAKIMTDLYPL